MSVIFLAANQEKTMQCISPALNLRVFPSSPTRWSRISEHIFILVALEFMYTHSSGLSGVEIWLRPVDEYIKRMSLGRNIRARLHQNQPYDESLEVPDAEEIASTYSPTPRVGQPGGKNGKTHSIRVHHLNVIVLVVLVAGTAAAAAAASRQAGRQQQQQQQ
ncbi:intraflagellar transport protein 46 homolog [Plakobranchus ocellatus]|uniref:Intraflagellar transport protein 46 homolog n=1 Tax=Plakobranchus ocellatus TaxID=259542 RepID=A0AAV4CP63_9GAST|nr:intraflagellar transport protein 46 homolog [Plakobranchus ocellatus]